MPIISNGEIGSSVRNKLNETGLRKNNFSASVVPTSNDDTGTGYEIGSIWQIASGAESGRIFVCTDDTSGAATWVDITASGSGGIDNVVDDTSPELGGSLDGLGEEIANYKNKVVSSVSGTLTTASHSGNVIVTSGNITIPTTAGFTATIRAGGAHTVTFNGATSAAMATGDVMTIVVEDSTTIHAALTPAADKVSFS